MANRLRFPYLPVKNSRGEVALRPQLPLTLQYQDQSKNRYGLLDTGADVNVLPFELGIALGAVWEEQRTILQLSGNFANYEARGIVMTATVAQFAPIRLAFAWTEVSNVPLILGQTNFFMEFDVCFFRAQQFFEVGPQSSTD